jgi:hypothetical protein
MSSQFIIVIIALIVALSLVHEWRQVAAAANERQIVLFSALEGRVIQGGKPLANAVLIREWDFAEDSVVGKDEVKTDARGYFRFPAVLHSYKPPIFLAQEMYVAQLIRVKATNKEWRVWSGSKRDHTAGSERSQDIIEPITPEEALKITIDLDAPRALRGGVVGHTFFDGPP